MQQQQLFSKTDWQIWKKGKNGKRTKPKKIPSHLNDRTTGPESWHIECTHLSLFNVSPTWRGHTALFNSSMWLKLSWNRYASSLPWDRPALRYEVKISKQDQFKPTVDGRAPVAHRCCLLGRQDLPMWNETGRQAMNASAEWSLKARGDMRLSSSAPGSQSEGKCLSSNWFFQISFPMWRAAGIRYQTISPLFPTMDLNVGGVEGGCVMIPSSFPSGFSASNCGRPSSRVGHPVEVISGHRCLGR